MAVPQMEHTPGAVRMLRILTFAVFAAVLAVGVGLPARSLAPGAEADFHYADVDRLVAWQRAGDWDAVRDEFAGQAVEILFTPTATVEAGGRVLLHDTRASLTCAVDRGTAARVAAPGDDFLVVRGVVGPVAPGRTTEIRECEVADFRGLAWSAKHRSERDRLRNKYRAGQA